MTRPPSRLIDTPEIPPPDVVRANTARVVTVAQVDRAVLQLRERRGRTAVEQVKAVLRALDLTVQERLAADSVD